MFIDIISICNAHGRDALSANHHTVYYLINFKSKILLMMYQVANIV